MVQTQDIVRQHLLQEKIIKTDDVFLPLSGGQTNSVWKISGTRDLICKLYSECTQNPLYENAPEFEYACLKQLSGKTLAPEAVCFLQTQHGDVLVYDYLDGDVWRNDVIGVAQLLLQLHRETPPQGLRELPVGSVALIKQTLDILKAVHPVDADMIAALKPDGFVVDHQARSFVHTDVVAGNIIQTTNGLRLIDWQCPGVGDPVEDLVMFISPAMQSIYRGEPLSEAERDAFIAAYDDTKVQERFKEIAPFYHWRMAAYCAWKQARGIAGYGNAKLLEIEALKQLC